jgi:3-hydroxymyristoyl/3-hydroxydecanoyl-(acyl carrier protein) dehydratase
MMSSTTSCVIGPNEDQLGWVYEAGPDHGDDEVTASVRFPAASIWFHEHFPGRPIVPGVALLSLAAELLAAAAGAEGRQGGVRGLSRVRFNHLAGPEERLEVRVFGHRSSDWRKAGLEVWRNKQRVCAGGLLLAKE